MEEGASRVWQRAFAGAREGVEIADEKVREGVEVADGKVRQGMEVARERIEEGADRGVRKAAHLVGR